jgi:hypothetical protein
MEDAMRTALAIAALATAGLVGCAAEPARVVRADCKVMPATTRGFVGKPAPVSELDRRWAEAQLRSSEYRRQELARNPLDSTVENALRDCP